MDCLSGPNSKSEPRICCARLNDLVNPTLKSIRLSECMLKKMMDDTEWNLADNLKYLRGNDVLEGIVISCLQKARSLVLNEDLDRDTGVWGRG